MIAKKEFKKMVKALPIPEKAQEELVELVDPVFEYHEFIKKKFDLDDEAAETLEQTCAQDIMAKVHGELEDIEDLGVDLYATEFIGLTCIKLEKMAADYGYKDAKPFAEAMKVLISHTIVNEQKRRMTQN